MRISGNSACESCGQDWAGAVAQPARRGGATGSPIARVSAEASESTQAALSLTTADGDRVVLSVTSGTSTAFDGRTGAGRDYRYLQRDSRQAEVQIQVEGNLSEAELLDIRKLAQIVSQASGDVLRGDAAGAARGVASAGELGSIQSFAYSLNKQVDYRYSLEA